MIELRTSAGINGSTVIPTMRYDDAASAIEWLCDIIGFRKHLIVPGENGSITHAQLVIGSGMIMLGSVRDDDFGKIQKPPAAVGDFYTQSAYVVVVDADAVYSRAMESGAKIVAEIQDADHGGRFFSCLDPEGQLWNLGTYNPWAAV